MASELPAGATLVAGQVKWTSEDALSYEVPIRHNCDFPGQSALSWGFALDENLNGLIGVDEPQGATEIFLKNAKRSSTRKAACVVVHAAFFAIPTRWSLNGPTTAWITRLRSM